MLNEEKRKALKESGRRITIFGKFTAKERKTPLVLRDTGEADGKVSAVGFFTAVMPELGSIRGVEEIGNSRINAFELCAPTHPKCSADKTFPILMDSPLLDALQAAGKEGTPRPALQNIGGQIFKSLLESIDVVASYSGRAFTSQLLEIGAQYIPRWMNTHQTIGIEKGWEVGVPRVLMTDPQASELIVNYLSCYPQDEPAIIIKLRERLDELKRDLEMDGREKLIDLACEALQACKQDLDDELTDEGVLGLLFKAGDFNHLSRCKDPVGLNTASFVKHYAHFMQNSNRIHRFARTESLHSFLLVWFSSKFHKHDEDLSRVSKVMYQRCVEEQPGRIPSLTQEEIRELQKLVDQVELDDEFRSKVNSRTEDLRKNFESNRAQRKKSLKTILTLPRKVTRELWKNSLRDLFVSVAQMSGGAVGELLELDRKMAKKYEKFYIDILRQDPEDLNAEAFIEKARRSLMDRALTDERSFVDEIFDIKDSLPEDVRAVRWLLTRRCVAAWEKRCDKAFAQGYVNQFDEIEREFNTLSTAFERIVLKRTVSSAEAKAGSIHVVTDMVLPDNIRQTKDAKQNRVEKMVKELAATSASASSSKSIATQVRAPKVLAPGSHVFYDANNMPLKGTEITISSEVDSADAQLTTTLEDLATLRDATVRATIDGEETSIPVAELDMPLDTILASAQSEVEVPPDFNEVKEMDRVLGERIESIRDAYNSDEENSDLEMGYRALLFGEYVLSAPPKLVNLGEDDLSGILAIIMDLVQNVGSDPHKNNDLFSNATLPESDVRLGGVNMSKYYRLGNSDDMSKIVQYHYSMCMQAMRQRDYLQEIVDIGHFLDNISGRGIEVIVYDQTLELQANIKQASQFCMVKYPSAFMFLSGQALARQFWNSFEGKYKEYMISSAAAELQFPVMVSAMPVSDGAPVIDPSVIKLPTFTERDHEGDGNEFVVDHVIQKEPFLLLCATAMTQYGDYGKVKAAYDQNVDFVRKNLGAFGLEDGAPVYPMLKHAWRSDPNLAGLIFVSRIYSMLRALKAQLNSEEDLGRFIHRLELDDFRVGFEGLCPLDEFLPTAGDDAPVEGVTRKWSIEILDKSGSTFADRGNALRLQFRDMRTIRLVPAPASQHNVPFRGELKLSQWAAEALNRLS